MFFFFTYLSKTEGRFDASLSKSTSVLGILLDADNEARYFAASKNLISLSFFPADIDSLSRTLWRSASTLERHSPGENWEKPFSGERSHQSESSGTLFSMTLTFTKPFAPSSSTGSLNDNPRTPALDVKEIALFNSKFSYSETLDIFFLRLTKRLKLNMHGRNNESRLKKRVRENAIISPLQP